MGAVGDAVNNVTKGIGGGLGGITHGFMNLIPGYAQGQEGQQQYQDQMNALISRIENEWQLPDYDKTPLTPQEFQQLAEYSPQVAAFVQQQQPSILPPDVVNKGTQAQQQALDMYGQLAKTGTDAGMQAQLEEAQMSADQTLRSNRANALQALANRGLGSSGATLGADIATSLGAAQQQRQASLEAASQAAQRKAQAIQGLGSLGTQIAGQEQQGAEFNANTMNNYNQILANRQQQYNQYAAQQQNQANMYNQQMAQDIANKNTGLQNQYSQYNRNREDTNKTNLANASNNKLNTVAGLQSGMYGQQNAYNQQQSQNMTNTFMNLVGMGTGAGGGLSKMFGSSNKGGGGINNAPDTGIGNQYTGGGYVTDYGNLAGMGAIV